MKERSYLYFMEVWFIIDLYKKNITVKAFPFPYNFFILQSNPMKAN